MELNTIYSIVCDELKNDKKCRADDNYLWYKVICRKNRNVTQAHSFAWVISHINQLNLPRYESVSRARRKAQAQHPDLRDAETQRHRNNKIAEYKAFAKEDAEYAN